MAIVKFNLFYNEFSFPRRLGRNGTMFDYHLYALMESFFITAIEEHASGRSHILPLLDAHMLFFPTPRPACRVKLAALLYCKKEGR